MPETHYSPLLSITKDSKISRWNDAPLESDLMNCQVSGPRLTGERAIFQSRGSPPSYCSRIMASTVHACRADYVTYCNARNAYKQKHRPPRTAGFRPRETQRFRGSSRSVEKSSGTWEGGSRRAGNPDERYRNCENARKKNNARPFITASRFLGNNRLSGIMK